jgi:hypothetical protein
VAPQPLQLGGRPGEGDGDGIVCLQHDPRRRPGEAERLRADRQRSLFRHPRCEIAVRPAQPLRDRARDAFDLALEPAIDDQLAPRDACQDLDGPVVMRRPQPARNHA